MTPPELADRAGRDRPAHVRREIDMTHDILFVCPHGAGKSRMAAACLTFISTPRRMMSDT